MVCFTFIAPMFIHRFPSDKAAEIIAEICSRTVPFTPSLAESRAEESSSWALKANVTGV